MNNDEFVRQFKILKNDLLTEYIKDDSKSNVRTLIKNMHLNSDQNEIMKSIIDDILNDTIYTILLGLDGCASIGNVQQPYKILTKDGKPIDGDDNIESCAWEYFHNKKGI